MIHPEAKIGREVKFGPFAEVGPRAEIGDFCTVYGSVEGKIGTATRVWRFAHVMEGAVVGENSQICNGAIVNTDGVVGDRTDVQLWTNVARRAVVGSDVFLGPSVVFCNHKRPCRQVSHKDLEPIRVCDRAIIGAHVSLMAGITVGEGALVGAGSVVTHDVPPGATVKGVPAR